MNRSGKFQLCLVGGMALSVIVRADDTVAPGDPYATVIARNIFGLNPPQPIDPHPQDANPPPKITPNGIISILGELQALYKVAGTPKPGSQSSTEQSYCLSEGQREDDIEVVKIDEKNSVVTFNNHGETQTLPLVTTMPTSTPAGGTVAPAGGRPMGPGGRFSPGVGNPGGGPGGRPSHSVGSRSGGTGANDGSASANPGDPGFGSNPGILNNSGHATVQNPLADQMPAPDFTPEMQTIGIELNRELTKQQVIQGDMPPLPITELTPPDVVGNGGIPLPPSDAPQ